MFMLMKDTPCSTITLPGYVFLQKYFICSTNQAVIPDRSERLAVSSGSRTVSGVEMVPFLPLPVSWCSAILDEHPIDLHNPYA